MKIMTILGSPRKEGNTAKVLGLFEELIAQDHEVDRINIAAKETKGCLGCGRCHKKTNEPGCAQKDETFSIIKRMMGADRVVYASPLYFWGFSSQMKAFLDRHRCLVKGFHTPDYKSLVEGKRTALLVTCAGPVENNAALILETFDRFGNYCKLNVVGKYIVPFCRTPDAIGEEGMEAAKKMARDIVEG